MKRLSERAGRRAQELAMQARMTSLEMENVLLKDLIEQLDPDNDWTFNAKLGAFVSKPIEKAQEDGDDSEICDNKDMEIEGGGAPRGHSSGVGGAADQEEVLQEPKSGAPGEGQVVEEQEVHEE